MPALAPFGSHDVPFAEPADLCGHHSPHYTADHRRWRELVRRFVEEHCLPHVAGWEERGEIPSSVRVAAYDAGVLGAMWPREYGGTPPPGSEGAWSGAWSGVKVDPFYDLIMYDELSRSGAGSVIAGLFGGTFIGLPPVLMFGSQALRDRVARPCITGQKTMCLCVTEPGGGSDVAAVRTTARRDGDCYVVNGSKKWITGGMTADFFTVLCRTGGASSKGLSMLLIEKGTPGLGVRRMRTQGWHASMTTFITFDDCRVPAANLIGKEGEGFRYTMVNFNHERFMMSVQANRYSRVCIEEAVRWARRRRTFGKRLADHQSIRHKVAEMGRRVESTHAMLEHYCYQVKSGVPDHELAGYTALAKVQATQVMEYCAREASQILGGASFTKDGAGAQTERLYREVRVMAIGGGSEEIMRDLAMRQARL